MRFRLARFSFKTGFSALFLLASSHAFATVTVYNANTDVQLGTNVYLPAINTNASFPITLATGAQAVPGTPVYDFGKYQYLSSNFLPVNVTWTPTTAPTGNFMLVVTMQGTISGNPTAVGEVVASTPERCPGVGAGGATCELGSPTITVTSNGARAAR